jgi:ubiquitin carboxyl-terminal hydrolase MINDY-1/2
MSERVQPDTLHASRADVWYLKEIAFATAEPKRRVKIITQNFNGCVSNSACACDTSSTSSYPSDRVHSSQSVSPPVLECGDYLAVAGNILILRGQIEILPYDRGTVSYEFLAQLVGGYLLMSCPGIDVSAALSIMPSTTSAHPLFPFLLF